MHASIDEGSGLIGKIEGTTASVHDSQVFAPLISGDEAEAYGDAGAVQTAAVQDRG